MYQCVCVFGCGFMGVRVYVGVGVWMDVCVCGYRCGRVDVCVNVGVCV